MNIKPFLAVSSLVITLLSTPFLIAAKTPVSVVVQKSEYVLPYPGILPDHPLYFLKQARDKILDFLIVDPLRKAEFYILQADKRLGMGMMLLDKGIGALAETTMSKGENYMEQAISSLVNLKASGKETPGYLVDRLERSVDKHIEVIAARSSNESGPVKDALTGLLERVKKLRTQAAKVK